MPPNEPAAKPRDPQSDIDLAIEIAGVRLPNPLVLASGILGTHASIMARTARAGAGAITAKSAGPARTGHNNPTCFPFGPGLLNAIGLANPGAEAEATLLAETKAALAPLGVPLIASIFAGTVEEFGRVAAVIAPCGADLLEVNISCPNVADDYGEPFAASCPTASAVTRAVKAEVDMPVVLKLAPNVPDIGRIAAAVVDAGADAICAVNTMPGMAIDITSGQPVLHNKSGGMSGDALRAIAVNAVYQVRAAVDVPIIGTGGVSSADHALELISAGATAVGIGSAVYAHGPGLFATVRDDLAAWLTDHDLTLDAARGRAHRRPTWAEAPTPPPIPHHSPSSPEHTPEPVA